MAEIEFSLGEPWQPRETRSAPPWRGRGVSPYPLSDTLYNGRVSAPYPRRITMAKFRMALSYEAVVTLDIEAPDADTAFDIAHQHLLDTRHDDISYSQEPTSVDLIDP